MTSTSLLQMSGVRKSFSGVEVLHGVDFRVEAGEVVALMGENGAGKSTLMKILGGDYLRDGGDILIDGRSVELRSPRDAELAGVRVIYQELNSAPDLSVSENVLMGHLPRRTGPLGGLSIDWRAAWNQTEEILATLGADIDAREAVGRLSVGEQQLVEIAKALSRPGARLLVLDEPTAALTSREVALLFQTIASLRASGVGLIYISHRLDEVQEIADRVTVLRDGLGAGDSPMSELSRREIVRLMVGRDVETLYPTRTSELGEPILKVTRLGRPRAFEDVSFEVRAGEIMGLYGLMGAGQSAVARALFASPPATSGEIQMAGRTIKVESPASAKHQGIGFVSEDRKIEGLVLGMGVADNLTLGNWSAISRLGVLSSSKEQTRAAHWTQVLGIRARDSGQIVGTLSGGNQQKVVLARWLEAGTRVLVLCEPTRGVDVGARADIYAVLETLRAQGLALVLVSSDIEEMLALCDRTLVFRRGRVVREFAREGATQETLLAAASGEEQ